jgi:sugar/nucleoside kinase (ribokinase family)
MKRITALSHPLIDVLQPCDFNFLRERGLTAGSYGLLSRSEQDALIHACGPKTPTLGLGGCASNALICARQLAIPCTLLGLAGDDTYGQHLYRQMRRLDIQTPLSLVRDGRTGTCLVLSTPDGERTMRTCHGVATLLGPEHTLETAIAASEWLILEGYFLTASEKNSTAITKAIALAKSYGTKIALSVGAEFVVHAKRDVIRQEILPLIDLIFANAAEAMRLTETSSPQSAITTLSKLLPSVIVTNGKHGAFGWMNNRQWHTPAFPSEGQVLNTTGAGDIFAGAFLAGLMKDLTPENSARGAARLASMIITHHEAQLGSDAKLAWEAATTVAA